MGLSCKVSGTTSCLLRAALQEVPWEARSTLLCRPGPPETGTAPEPDLRGMWGEGAEGHLLSEGCVTTWAECSALLFHGDSVWPRAGSAGAS